MKPYYQDDMVSLYHGDSEEILSTISEVDLVVTSPPYNLGGSPWPHLGHWKKGDKTSGGGGKWRGGVDSADGVAYAAHEDAMPWAEYVNWQRRVLAACYASLSDRGAIFYNHKPRVIGTELWTPLELNPGLPLRQIIVWARAGGMNYSPVSYMPTHEWLMVLAKPAFRLKNQAASGVGDVWRISQDRANNHPAPFPLALPATAIETTAPRLVFDPFAGSGTTLRAAKDASVRAIGVEKSERYCEMAATRLAQEAFDFGDWEEAS